MQITIQGTGMDLTEALKGYATEKIESLDRLHDHIQSAKIEIGLRSNHHQKGKIYFAEVMLHIPHNHIIRVVKEAEDLYKAIDKVRDHMKVELEKIKGKLHGRDREEIRSLKEFDEGDQSDEE